MIGSYGNFGDVNMTKIQDDDDTGIKHLFCLFGSSRQFTKSCQNDDPDHSDQNSNGAYEAPSASLFSGGFNVK